MTTVKLLYKHFKQLKYCTCSNWYFTSIQLLPVTKLCITQQQIEGNFWRCCIAFGCRYILQIHYGLLLREHLPRTQESLECDCYNDGFITHICLKQANFHWHDENKVPMAFALTTQKLCVCVCVCVCVCGQKINIEHALSCKKRGSIIIGHNQVRDTTANLLKIICSNVKSNHHYSRFQVNVYQRAKLI